MTLPLWQQARKVQFEMPAFSQSRSNAAAAGGYDARKRGANADQNKTGIDALLNPKHAGAQPYRLVLGEVWNAYAVANVDGTSMHAPMVRSARLTDQRPACTVVVSSTQHATAVWHPMR